MFSLNTLDHVNDFSTICSEIVRVLKPGGEFIGSFNINQPASVCEPQKLNEKIIKDKLLVFFNINQYRLSDLGPASNCYEPLIKKTFFMTQKMRVYCGLEQLRDEQQLFTAKTTSILF